MKCRGGNVTELMYFEKSGIKFNEQITLTRFKENLTASDQFAGSQQFIHLDNEPSYDPSIIRPADRFR